MHVCLVSPGHPANNPRLVRNASALSVAGMKVTVISPRFDSTWAGLEERATAGARWTYVPVDFLTTREGRRRWKVARAQRRIAAAIARRTGMPYFEHRGVPYGYGGLVDAARRVDADVYVAQQHAALPIVFEAVGKRFKPVIFDAEDLLAEQPSPDAALSRRIEQRFIDGCALVTTMSGAAADHLQQANGLRERPLVLHNSPSLQERAGITPPYQRASDSLPTVYWFGQTIGVASRADQIIRAMPHVETAFRFVLRGMPTPAFRKNIETTASEVGCGERVEIRPLASPAEMVALAAESDVLFGSQPGCELYYQCAIGNKVMTGVLAGLVLLLTDTTAHRQLLREFPGIGECVRDQDEHHTAEILNRWFSDPNAMRRIQERCWNLAAERLNWEQESSEFVRRVLEVGR